MNVSELLERNGRKFEDKTAVIEHGRTLSYSELDKKVNRLAHAFQQKGITKGDKVLLFMPNTSSFIISYFAVIRLGAVIVPVSARLTEHELSYMLEHSQAKMMVVEHLLYNSCAGLPGGFPDVTFVKNGEPVDGWHSFEAMLEEGNPDLPIASESTEDDPVTMLYTSGTTGKPKGVLFSNRNVLSVAIMMAIEMEMKPESNLLHIMPLSHSAPLHLFLAAGTYVGATHSLVPSFTPDLLLDAVENWRTTHFFGAPVAYLMTAKHPEINQRDLSSMTHWVYGGAPLGHTEVRMIQDAFQSDRFYCVYGLTEAGPNGTLLSPEEHSQKAGSIGKRAALNAEIRLVDDQGEDVSPGTPGEIILYGEGNMLGYYKETEKTADTLKNGWLFTGDMAIEDEDGYYWVIDRKKDMIISGGVNIFPKEIEETLAEFPAVAESAVIGVPHKDWGETVTAYVVLNKDQTLDEEAVKSFLAPKIADYKIPKRYIVIDELPRNPTGKILKHHLKDRH